MGFEGTSFPCTVCDVEAQAVQAVTAKLAQEVPKALVNKKTHKKPKKQH